jgi:O-antigen/teichoic acid export membrane protein
MTFLWSAGAASGSLKRRVETLARSPFLRSVAMVATGTAAAQAITLTFYPLITRIYGPEALGALGVFMSAVAILTPVAAFAYPTAIVLPKPDTDAKGLMRLAVIVASAAAAVVAILLVVFSEKIVALFELRQIAPFILLLPLVMLFTAMQDVMQQWLIRRKQFFLTAKVAVLQALFLNGARAGLGLIHPFASTLIVISAAGYVLYAAMLAAGGRWAGAFRNVGSPDAPVKRLGALAREYRDFPLYRAPQDLLNALSHGLPVILLASFYGARVVGFYTLAVSILAAPGTLIGNAVGNVLYPRLAEAAHKSEDLRRLVLLPTSALFAVGILPFGTIMLVGPWLFIVIFGVEWRDAGEYARWLSLWILCGFANVPSVRAVPVIARQRAFLLFGAASAVARTSSVAFAYLLGFSELAAVILISVSGSVLNLFLVYMVDRAILQFQAGSVK